MTKTILILVSSLLLLSACKKKLDLDSGDNFDVSTFLRSKNCDVNCDSEINCGGRTVGLSGTVDPYNIFINKNRFFLVGEEGSSIEVHVDSTISDYIFDKMTININEKVVVKGLVETFDMPTNISCRVGYYLNLSDSADFISN